MAATHVTAVATTAAPAAVGPYSQAVSTGEASGCLVFVSGQVPLDPATGSLVEGGIQAQAEQVLRNLGAILSAAGLGYGDVVKTTVLLADIADFAAVNEVYARFFGGPEGSASAARPASPGGVGGSGASASATSVGLDAPTGAGTRVLPARAAFGVAALPLGARVEVEAVAVRP